MLRNSRPPNFISSLKNSQTSVSFVSVCMPACPPTLVFLTLESIDPIYVCYNLLLLMKLISVSPLQSKPSMWSHAKVDLERDHWQFPLRRGKNPAWCFAVFVFVQLRFCCGGVGLSLFVASLTIWRLKGYPGIFITIGGLISSVKKRVPVLVLNWNRINVLDVSSFFVKQTEIKGSSLLEHLQGSVKLMTSKILP